MSEKTKYQMVANIIRTDIAQRMAAESGRLPTEMELAQLYSVSRQTIRQALNLLEKEGLVERKQGSGTYVSRDQGRFKTDNRNVGVIFSYITEYIFPSIVRGIVKTLDEKGFTLSLSSTHNRTDNERAKLEYYLAHPVSGLIIEGTKTALPNPNINLYEELEARGTSIVFIHACYDQLKSPISVTVDDRAGGRAATEFLLDRGHSKIAAILKSDDKQGVERCTGFMQAVSGAGLTLNDDSVCWYNDLNRAGFTTSAQLKNLINSHTAIICYNDMIALDVLKAIKLEGKSVPEDLSLISFDDSLYASIASPNITSLSHPKDELGRVAAEKVVNMIYGKQETPKIFQWKTIERASLKKLAFQNV